MKTVCISGYFNPVHSGHIEYAKEAKKLGDKLIVIVDNDHQVELKKSIKFQTESERVKIISSLKCVDEVVLSIDVDNSVCKTLEMIKPDVFAKGGDRNSKNIPEVEICKKLGIKIVDGIGGNKTNSSSELLKNVLYQENDKPWGKELVLYKKDQAQSKLLEINKHDELSLQYHKDKIENLMLTKGTAFIFKDGKYEQMILGKVYIINSYELHRIKSGTNSQILEISFGYDEDIVRTEDKYNRK